MYKEGRIIAITGPVCSGKSNKLISYTDKFDAIKTPYIIYKPIADKRDVSDTQYFLRGRGGVKKQAHPAITAAAIAVPPDIGILILDEVQFFDGGLIPILDYYASIGMTCICGGLKQDSNRMPYETMSQVLAIADEAYYMYGYCVVCAKEKIMRYGQHSWKVGNNKERNDCKSKYVPVCRKHHHELERQLIDPMCVDASAY